MQEAMFFAAKRHAILAECLGSGKMHAAMGALHHQFGLVEPRHFGIFGAYRVFFGANCPHYQQTQ